MNLNLTILGILDSTDGFQLALDVVAAEVRLRGRAESNTEVREALRKLDAQKQVIGITNADAPGGSKWKLTDAGRARLMEAGL